MGMRLPSYEQNLEAIGQANPEVTREAGPVSPNRPAHVLMGMILILVAVAVLYNVIGKELD